MQTQQRKYKFTWDIHHACNFRCPYCWFHGKWDDLKGKNYYPGTEALVAVWKKIYNRYGTAQIEIVGGEPIIYPEVGAVLAGLLQYHTLSVSTNLSADLDDIIRATEHKKDRLVIWATFHPLFADTDDFIKNVKQLKERSFTIGVNYLAWPGQLSQIPDLRQRLHEIGVQCGMLTFWGTYNGKEYPLSYTDEERAIIDPLLQHRGGEVFQTTPVSTLGKLCNAGHYYGVIQPNGTVLRCGGGGFGGVEERIGNIFDEKFVLWDAPAACKVPRCPCNEWAELLVEK